MNIILQWLQNNLDVVYFIYGLAFVVMGIAILVQPRKESSFKLAEILWLLAGFGVTHGINEWLDMWAIIKGSNIHMDLIRWICLISSYIFLFEFGRRLFRITSQGSCQKRISRYLVWWLAPMIMLIIIVFGLTTYDFLKVVTILTRYSFGFLGSFLTAFGFFFYYQSNKDIFAPLKTKGYFILSSFSFMIYGILGGLIVPKGEFFPSNLINTETFLLEAHVPAQVFRSILAIIAAFSVGGLLKIFNWEQRKKLQQSLYEWTNTFNSISDFLSVQDMDYRFVRVNRALANLLKKHPDELIGKHCYEFLHNTSEPWITCPHTETIELKKAVTKTIIDDNFGALLVTTSPIFDINGVMTGSVHIAKDISILTKIEQELEIERSRLKSILNSMKDGVYIINRNYDIEYRNPVIESEFGAVDGRKCYQYFHDQTDVCKECVNIRVFAGESVYWERSFKNKKIYDQYDLPFKNTDGSISKLKIIRDITKRKLRQERDKVFINTSIDGFLVIAKDGRLLEVNDAYCSLIGYSREELLTMSLSDIKVVEKPEDFTKHLKLLIEKGGGRFESLNRCKDGNIVEVEVSTNYIWDEEIFFSFVRDISEQKRRTKELLELNLNLKNRVAEEVEKNRINDALVCDQFHQIAMSELLINIAHQWRQPLNAIGMIAQSIRDDFQYKELTNESLDSSTKMIMEELIKLSTTIKTITDGHFKDEKRHEINVSQAVMIGINAMKNQLASNNISLETKIEDDILALGSFNIIIQAIITVITNSLEIFIERKIKDRYIKVETIKDTTNNKVIISIEDNGGGIDKELIDKIFDPYFTTKFKSRGKGMSLYLVKTMIERKMEGSIRIRNTYVGVEFIIEVCCYGS